MADKKSKKMSEQTRSMLKVLNFFVLVYTVLELGTDTKLNDEQKVFFALELIVNLVSLYALRQNSQEPEVTLSLGANAVGILAMMAIPNNISVPSILFHAWNSLWAFKELSADEDSSEPKSPQLN